MRDVPCAAAIHGAWQQSACTQRDRGGLLPSRPLADSYVPHCPVGRLVDASEGRLLSRWTIRRPTGRGQPLRRPFQAQSQHRAKERLDRVPEGNLSVESPVISPESWPGLPLALCRFSDVGMMSLYLSI